MKTVKEYLALDWHQVIEGVNDEDGKSYRLTIPLLPDFAVYGSLKDIDERFAEALESHLAGYLAVGKVIPEPLTIGPAVQEQSDDTGSAGGTNTVTQSDLVAA